MRIVQVSVPPCITFLCCAVFVKHSFVCKLTGPSGVVVPVVPVPVVPVPVVPVPVVPVVPVPVVPGGVVGVVPGGVVPGGVDPDEAHSLVVITLVSKVTAAVCASNRPWIVVPVSAVIDAKAITVPIKCVPVPNVAEEPTCQKTLQA